MFDALFMGVAAREQALKREADRNADQAAATASEARSKVERMQMDVEKLLMITEALWIMLRDEHGYTDEQLIEKVQEIDLRDGRLDGKVAKQGPTKCPQCGRAIAARRPMCMFCGAPNQGDPFQR